MEVQTQIDIDAAPERVWAVLTDFERHPAWNPFIREIRGEVREGARLHVRLGPPDGKPMTFNPVVTSAELARSFSWLGTLLAPWVFRGEHRFLLEPLGPDRTRFHHGESFGGVLVPVLKRSLDTATRRGFELMNAALKAEAEKSAASLPAARGRNAPPSRFPFWWRRPTFARPLRCVSPVSGITLGRIKLHPDSPYVTLVVHLHALAGAYRRCVGAHAPKTNSWSLVSWSRRVEA